MTEAKAISGDKAFHQTAIDSAKKSKFEVPKLSLEIIKVTGEIYYTFAKDKTVKVNKLLRNVEIKVKPNKYQSSVKDLVKNGNSNAKFVRNGSADLIVRVNELNPETISAIKKLGFNVLTEMRSANAVVGSIAVDKIDDLAELEAVTFISPQIR